ncbi:MAG: STAS domain-containing protein [bacterium]|nr:STAS domain-containing protein [bacterium]
MSDLSINISYRAIDKTKVALIDCDGPLDSETFFEFEKILDKEINEQNYRIIINMEHLSYVSSASLGVLMGALQQVRDGGGDLKVTNVTPKIKNLFDMLGFSRLLNIYDTDELALKAFAAEAKKL